MEIWLVIGGIAFLFFFIKFMVPAYKRSYVDARDKAANEYRQKRNAPAFAAGVKPYGASIGGDLHGSAYFLSAPQILEKRLGERLDTDSNVGRLILGGLTTTDSKNNKTSAYVLAPEIGHIITVAPTRAGKGAGLIIPNLLRYCGSVIVNDMKGENADITTKSRTRSGHKVYRFAPFEENSAKWNPLDAIGRVGSMDADSALMANMLIVDDGKDSGFWKRSAENLLQAVILHVMTDSSIEAEERTLSTIVDLFMQPENKFEIMLDDLSVSDNNLIRNGAIGFTQCDAKLQGSILATISSNLTVWNLKEAEAVTGSSDFNFEDLKNEQISIYFCIPPKHKNVYVPLMRLFFGQAIDAMSQNMNQPNWPVTFILDEFPLLGRMKSIEEGMAYLAGYGVKLWLFAQTRGQINNIYGRNGAETIFSNCSTRIFFGTNDIETRDMVSKTCGQMTVPVINTSKSKPDGFTTNQGSTSESVNLIGRPLLMPEEVERLSDNDSQVIFFQGEMPVLCELVRYYKYTNLYNIHDYDSWKGAPDYN